MTIMIAMMALLLPAFSKMTSGQAVNSAARMVSAQLMLARQYAIAQRESVAVIMPGPIAVAADCDPAPLNQYRYSCMRPAIVSSTPNPSVFNFERWVPNTEWVFLPTGACIMEADWDLGIRNDTPPLATPPVAADLQLTPVDNQYSQVGVLVGGKHVNLQAIGGDATAINVRCVVFAPTGRIKGVSNHVTVGEAVYTGGAAPWVIRNPVMAGDPLDAKTLSCANQINVEINAFTGRTEMRTPDKY